MRINTFRLKQARIRNIPRSRSQPFFLRRCQLTDGVRRQYMFDWQFSSEDTAKDQIGESEEDELNSNWAHRAQRFPVPG